MNKFMVFAVIAQITLCTQSFASSATCQQIAQRAAEKVTLLNGAKNVKSIITGWKMTVGDLDLWKIEVLGDETNNKRKVTTFEVVTGQSEGPCQISSVAVIGEAK